MTQINLVAGIYMVGRRFRQGKQQVQNVIKSFSGNDKKKNKKKVSVAIAWTQSILGRLLEETRGTE